MNSSILQLQIDSNRNREKIIIITAFIQTFVRRIQKDLYKMLMSLILDLLLMIMLETLIIKITLERKYKIKLEKIIKMDNLRK